MNVGVDTELAFGKVGCVGSVGSVDGAVPSGVPPSTHALMVAIWSALSVGSSWKVWQLPS